MTRGKMGIFGGAAVLVLSAAIGFGQVQDYPAQPAPPAPQSSDQGPPQLLTGPQLDNLVSPVALYPDPLLGQVLAASTYPLEIVELGQWQQQNRNLRGQQLIDAAKQMNWDPSVQALVAFPDAVTMLTRDIRWTTDLGNAFLTQQADVMNAVQRMRAAARNNGRLNSGPQQTVTTETQDGQTAIQIQPTDPQIVYVPTYNPAYVWGPPIWGAYPPLYYPPIGYGFGFGYPCYLGGFFGGFLGFGGWGWGLGWFGHGLFVNGLFFNHYGFHGYGYGGLGARGAWAHNPEHRLGVSYPNRAVANRYNSGAFRGAGANRGAAAGGWRSFNRGSGTTARAGAGPGAYRGNSNNSSNYSSNYRGGTAANRGYSNAAPRGNAGQSYHNGPAAQSYGRSPGGYSQGSRGGQSFAARPQSSVPRYSAPSQHYSAPSQHFSAPRSSGGGFSGGGHSGGGFSGSRSSGGHSSGGGGHSGGGHSGGGRR
jgi:hypothetical protein